MVKELIRKFCPSKMNCKIPDCNKRHHFSLHNSIQITTQENQNTASNNLNNNNLEVNTFLRIICITILNGTKYIKNTLLDTGSDMKLLNSDLAIKLGPNADSKSLRIRNGISKISELESNQIFFKVLSKSLILLM